MRYAHFRGWWLILAALPAVLSAQTSSAPGVSLPDTPAGRAFGQWLNAYNAADSVALSAYKRTYEPEMNLALAIAGRAVSGGADVESVERNEPYHLELVLKTRRTGLVVYGVIDVGTAQPTRVSSVLTVIGKTYDANALRIEPAARADALDSLAAKVERNYVVAEVGRRIADSIRARKARGAYDTYANQVSFAQRLTNDLVETAHDKHMTVSYTPSVLRPSAAPPGGAPRPAPGGAPPAPRPSPGPQPGPLGERPPCGYESKILDGDVGYLAFSNFRMPEECGADVAKAMSAIADTRALIIDLRLNGGGAAEMVPFIASYVVSQRTHLHDVTRRAAGPTEEVWTRDDVPGARFGGSKPVYILTSSLTISAAEAFAYDLQSVKRAVIVGESTAGAANMTAQGQIGDHLLISISIARPVSPVTGTNWEAVGVTPDILVPASEALATAQRLISDKGRDHKQQ